MQSYDGGRLVLENLIDLAPEEACLKAVTNVFGIPHHVYFIEVADVDRDNWSAMRAHLESDATMNTKLKHVTNAQLLDSARDYLLRSASIWRQVDRWCREITRAALVRSKEAIARQAESHCGRHFNLAVYSLRIFQ